MGRHDSKQIKLQVEIIQNIDPLIEAISVEKKLRGSGAFDTSNPLDYVMRKDIETFSEGGVIRPYDPDTSVDQNGVISFFIDGTRYLFISQVDGNTSVPGFDNNTYQVAGLYKRSRSYNQADLIEESYGGVWYLPFDLNYRDIISIGVTLASNPTVTNYIDLSQVVTDLNLTPSTKISGFPSNEAQTIIIKTI